MEGMRGLVRRGDDSSDLLCHRLNHWMIHFPAQNRAVRLHNNLVGSTVIHNRPLLAQRMKLRTGKEVTSFNDHENNVEHASIWFTAGICNPACLISSRCLTPLD